MGQYGRLERELAEKLNSFPSIKKYIKRLYQIISYLIFRKRGFSFSLHPKTQIITPEKEVQVPNLKNEFFFGYYDKSPWNKKMTKMVFHEVREDGKVNIVIFDKEKRSKNIIASSNAWNFQQGSMAQWTPTENEQIIFNDVRDQQLIARTISVMDGRETVYPLPVQAFHPEGREYLSLNYKKLSKLRPDYGYWQEVDNFSDDLPADQDGIWHYDIQTGEGRLIISLENLIGNIRGEKISASRNKVNHLIYSPTGDRFVFMHRWFTSQGKFSRLYVADNNGTNLKLLLDDRMVSHYHWRDDRYLIAWARTEELGNHYYLIDVEKGTYDVVGRGILNVHGDGHPSFSPNRRWIITDTYPDKARVRYLLLYDTQKKALTEIGKFLSPLRFEGETRCDLHPRWSHDGNYICIDSVHSGLRKSYILDISNLIETLS